MRCRSRRQTDQGSMKSGGCGHSPAAVTKRKLRLLEVAMVARVEHCQEVWEWTGAGMDDLIGWEWKALSAFNKFESRNAGYDSARTLPVGEFSMAVTCPSAKSVVLRA